MKKLPHFLNVISGVLVIIAVLYKVIGALAVQGGVGVHYAPLGVSPRGFLLLAGILLLFSIAINVQRLAQKKSSATLSGGGDSETTES